MLVRSLDQLVNISAPHEKARSGVYVLCGETEEGSSLWSMNILNESVGVIRMLRPCIVKVHDVERRRIVQSECVR